jgi:GNAT superfamily N-acetyltransferase
VDKNKKDMMPALDYDRNSLTPNPGLAAKMSGAFAIRVAALEDGTQLCELLSAAYPALMRESYSAQVLKAALPQMTRANPVLLKSGTFYVAQTKGGQFAGCGGWTFERPGSGETVRRLAHIRHFATHPNWLRQGIGRSIYRWCEDFAYSAGVREFECLASLNAVGFYESLGFKTTANIQLAMGPGISIPTALMTRNL